MTPVNQMLQDRASLLDEAFMLNIYLTQHTPLWYTSQRIATAESCMRKLVAAHLLGRRILPLLEESRKPMMEVSIDVGRDAIADVRQQLERSKLLEAN